MSVWGQGQPGCTESILKGFSLPSRTLSGWVSGKAVGGTWGMWVTIWNGRLIRCMLAKN